MCVAPSWSVLRGRDVDTPQPWEMSPLINQVWSGQQTPQLSEWCEGRELWVQPGDGSQGRLPGDSGDVCISLWCGYA